MSVCCEEELGKECDRRQASLECADAILIGLAKNGFNDANSARGNKPELKADITWAISSAVNLS